MISTYRRKYPRELTDFRSPYFIHPAIGFDKEKGEFAPIDIESDNSEYNTNLGVHAAYLNSMYERDPKFKELIDSASLDDSSYDVGQWELMQGRNKPFTYQSLNPFA